MSNRFLTFLFFILISSSMLFSQDGTLDPTFGNGGIVEIEQNSSRIIQHKLLPNNQSLMLTVDGSFLKVNEDGSLDNTFGDNGVVNLKDIIGSSNSLQSKFNDFDFTSTGEIIIGGVSELIDSTGTFLVVVKLNENGDVNSDFGNNGTTKISLEFHGITPIFLGNGKVAITQNDKVIVTKVENKQNESIYTRLIRLNSDGTIDNSFGTDGSFKNYYFYDSFFNQNRIQIDFDGNIFYAEGYHIAKILETGVLDTTFGNSGYFGDIDLRVSDIDFQSDGKIIGTFTGFNIDVFEYAVIGRLSQNGLIDSSFGLNGFKYIYTNTNDLIFCNSIITNEDDIISLGYAYTYDYDNDSSSTYSILTKLSHNGNFIEDFGDSGKVEINLYSDGKEYPNGIFINPENYNITISATREQADDNYSILLARFYNSKTISRIHVSGNVSGTWDADTVYVDGDITIPLNNELTVNPGTYVYFTGEYKFDVYGTLTANGTENDSIFFASDSLGEISDWPYYKGFWYGITFHSTDENEQTPSSLDYCNIKYAFPTWLDEMSNRYGGGLIFYKSEVNVSNSTITDCKDDNLDRGIFSAIHSDGSINNLSFSKTTTFRAGTMTLLSSNLTINNLSMTEAFGMYIDSSAITIENSNFQNCTPYIQWGIINSENSEIEMNNSQIINNAGIGIYAKFSEFTVKHTLIKNNSAEGGLFIESPSTFVNCEIIGNGSNGLRFQTNSNWGTTFTSDIRNCVIAKNNATGIKFTSRNNANFTNCTIADNNSSSGWGGIVQGEVDTHLNNCIVYNNGNNLDFQAGGLYTYSIIQGNYVGSDTATTNLENVDPLFRDAANGDYHLQSIACGYGSDSPAIDAGDPNIGDYIINCESGGLATTHSDIGAYGGADNWWDNSIVPSCHYSGEVWGTWDCENITIDGDIIIPEGDTLIISSSVDKVIFSGPYQIKVQGVLLAIGAEREGITELDADYIKFQGGNWKGIFFNNLNNSDIGTSIIQNCRFDYADKMDMTYQGGGAIAIYNSDNVEVKQTVFFENKARFGGAIYIENSNPHIEDCYFELNGKEIGQNGEIVTEAGGAIYIKDANPYLHKLRFISNRSTGGGGAIVLDNSSPVISNVLFVKNQTNGLGGAVQCFNGSSPKFVNITSADNIAETAGGTFYLNPNSNPDIINSIMFGNSKPEIFLDGGTPTITYSIVDSAANETYFGVGCLDTDPRFEMTIGNYYYLSSTACGYDYNSNAIDAGHPDSLDAVLDCEEGLGTERADMGYYGGRYSEMPVGVENGEENNTPKTYALLQNYPNPFNPTTTIEYSIPNVRAKNYSPQQNVQLKIYDVLGREIATLVNQKQSPGNYSVKFDASNLPSGIYFYRIHAGDFIATKKMILMK